MALTSAWVSSRVVFQTGQVLVPQDVVSDSVGIVAQDAKEGSHPSEVAAAVKLPKSWDIRIDDRVCDLAVQALH